jgi:transcriptional regulator with XRE-family HTH domain
MTACPPNLRKVPHRWKSRPGSTPMGARLKTARMEAGYTVRAFAETIGCAESSITGLENRGVKCDLDILCAMCDVLSITLDYLVRGK